MGDPLSQEEIDRLLAQAAGGGGQQEQPQEPQAAGDQESAEPQGEAEATPELEVVSGQSEVEEETPAATPAPEPEPQPVAQAAAPRQPKKEPSVLGARTSAPATAAQSVQFGPLPGSAAVEGAPRSLDLLLDIRLQLTAELGRKEMTIREALSLGPGSVLELDKIAGEPVDLLVNNKLIARGEVVVIDENFGVRVTEVVSPEERMDRVA